MRLRAYWVKATNAAANPVPNRDVDQAGTRLLKSAEIPRRLHVFSGHGTESRGAVC
jgi:hypothetical protein